VLQPFAIEPINPYMAEMKATAQRLAARGRGLLDTAEAAEDLGSRLARVGAGGAEEDRRDWREALFAAKGLEECCSAVVLEQEALQQRDSEGRTFVELLQEQGIVVGVRADIGHFPLNGYGERGTDGLADLAQRCKDYYELGIRFVKWVTKVECTMELPTDVAVWENTTSLAQCAQVCQANGLVLVAELEVSQGQGNHSMERAAYVSEKVYSNAVRFFNEYDANLEAVVLMVRACLPGPEAAPARPEEVAEFTVRSLLRTVPPALLCVQLATSGCTPEDAARYLRSIQEATVGAPWAVLPAYGVALLAPAMASWGKDRDAKAAQELVLRFLRASNQIQLGASGKSD